MEIFLPPPNPLLLKYVLQAFGPFLPFQAFIVFWFLTEGEFSCCNLPLNSYQAEFGCLGNELPVNK